MSVSEYCQKWSYSNKLDNPVNLLKVLGCSTVTYYPWSGRKTFTTGVCRMLGGSSSSSSGSSSSSAGGNNAKKITEGYLHQISILRVLSESSDSNSATGGVSGRHYQIHEIAEISGLKDERETQRFLYILEGQKLVSPHPAGDFTSRHWYITKEGIRALKTVADSGMA